MTTDWNFFWRDPFFLIGLLVKTMLIFLIVPTIQEQWFVPFVVSVIEQPTLSPWTQFLEQGGDSLAFPYGLMMLLVHFPTVLIGYLVDIIFSVDYFSGVGFRVSLLLADFLVLLLLVKMFSEHMRKFIIYYWLSPILIYITYWHGQTDIIPVVFLVLGLFLLKKNYIKQSAVLLAFAISAKISMLIVAPLFLIYLWNNKKLRGLIGSFTLILILTILLIQGPFLMTSGYQEMLLGNREISKIYLLSVQFGENVKLYITPLVYLVTLYLIWRIKRMNFDLLLATIGVSFFIIILMTPASLGWFVWLTPFFAIHQIHANKTAGLLVLGLAILLITYHVFKLNDYHTQSVWFTLISTIGIILAIQMLREGVHGNDYYKLSRQALSIGISGDSNSSNNTLALLLSKLFDSNSVTQVLGDNYRIWNKKSPVWKSLTSLNPRANNLFQFVNDVLALIHGKNVVAPHYDKDTGVLNHMMEMQTNDVIIVSGVHTLYSKVLCRKMDLSIYLKVDETLYQYFKLQRGGKYNNLFKIDLLGTEDKENQLDRRKLDIKKYITPQKQQADIIFSLMPVNSNLLNSDKEPSLKLKVSLVNGMFYQELTKLLIGICNLHIDVSLSRNSGHVELNIEGEVDAEDLALSARSIMPHMEELLGLQPEWKNNMQGVMQLIILAQLSEVLEDRK
jgi:uridine kinase